jgi:hypothetical protein
MQLSAACIATSSASVPDAAALRDVPTQHTCTMQDGDRRKLQAAGCAAIFEPDTLYHQGTCSSTPLVQLLACYNCIIIDTATSATFAVLQACCTGRLGTSVHLHSTACLGATSTGPGAHLMPHACACMLAHSPRLRGPCAAAACTHILHPARIQHASSMHAEHTRLP